MIVDGGCITTKDNSCGGRDRWGGIFVEGNKNKAHPNPFGTLSSSDAGVVILADGTAAAAEKLKRVLHNDPALGVVRHADAGYERAMEVAKEHSLGLSESPPQ